MNEIEDVDRALAWTKTRSVLIFWFSMIRMLVVTHCRHGGGGGRVMPIWWRWIWRVLDLVYQLGFWAGWWAWVTSLGSCWAICVLALLCYELILILLSILIIIISPYQVIVWRVGLNVCVCTQSALSVLEKWRVIIKWAQSPSGRMKQSVAGGYSSRQHNGRADLIVL
ncbi:hypothetical protein RchiOBHm_Chr4g0405571 [Rosa chinensis]|uniref:Uncharacterized protein n=1 Tax=Rosa chinensis TaxID=74649 RepID=A0A2P6QU41_ROSCH|nr:hypothetical protein RchiOBHm_Chr4g0405571 [Rosa chinensis]